MIATQPVAPQRSRGGRPRKAVPAPPPPRCPRCMDISEALLNALLAPPPRPCPVPDLSPAEERVFWALVARSPEPLSHEALAIIILGPHAAVPSDSHLVRVNCSRLRAKLNGSRYRLENIVRHGYRLVELQ